jgi:membrane-associated protein
MPLWRFQAANLAGGAGWVTLFLIGGYGFGNLPWVRSHFSLVTLGVIGVSLLPLLGLIVRSRHEPAAGGLPSD